MPVPTRSEEPANAAVARNFRFAQLGWFGKRSKKRFGRGRILVVGDLMLDVYLRGDVVRISPEAPVPVVRLSRRTETPGGAGNVLLNLAGLGLPVTAAGIVGDDDAGRRLRYLLEEAGIETRPIVVC